MTDADRTERLKEAGILDEAGDHSPRYRDPASDGKVRATSASR
jgi:hypothetical protein